MNKELLDAGALTRVEFDAQPTLAECAEIFKRDLELEGDNIPGVVKQAAELLGVDADLPLIEGHGDWAMASGRQININSFRLLGKS